MPIRSPAPRKSNTSLAAMYDCCEPSGLAQRSPRASVESNARGATRAFTVVCEDGQRSLFPKKFLKSGLKQKGKFLGARGDPPVFGGGEGGAPPPAAA